MAENKKNKKIVKVVDIIRVPISTKERKAREISEEYSDGHQSRAISELEDLVRAKEEPHRYEETKPAKKSRKAKKFLIIFSVLLVLAIIGYVALMVLPKVDIKIVTKKVNWQNQISITVNKNLNQIDADSLQIPGEVIKQQKNTVLQFTPTGKKYIEKKAYGTVTIYNAYSSAPQTLVATTRLETPDGKIYRLVDKVTIPGAKVDGGKITPSSTSANVAADKAGPDYNIGAVEKLTIPGLKGTPKFDSFYAKAPNGFAGGFLGQGLYPTADDIRKAKEQAQGTMQEALMAVFLSQVPQGFTYVENSVNATTTKITVNTTTDANNQFSVVADGQVQVMVFQESDVLSLLKQLAQKGASLSQDYTEKSKTLTYGKATTDWKLGKMSLPVNYSIVYWEPIDIGQLSSAVAGKSDVDLKSYILNLPGVDRLSVSFWPFWVSSVPKNTDKINTTVE